VPGDDESALAAGTRCHAPAEKERRERLILLPTLDASSDPPPKAELFGFIGYSDD
jgi:hypothetical protein